MTHPVSESYSVYPGEYKPLAPITRKSRAITDTCPEATKLLIARIIECPDHYKIEIAASGYTKEELIIHIEDEKMIVTGVKSHSKKQDGDLQYNDIIEFGCFENSILLPSDIDTDFLRADYKNGLLSVCFHKTAKPVLHTSRHVIVY